jgi:hypothetical protein
MKILRKFWITAAFTALLLSACSGPGPTSPAVNTTASTPPAAVPNQASPASTQQTGNSNCTQAALVPTPTAVAINPAYPTPLSSYSSSYPAPGLSGYAQPDQSYPAPAPSPTPRKGADVMLVPFRIQKPVLAGTTQVTGTGPANVPVTLANLSLMGDILGESTIQPDCTYTIQLSKPLEKNTWIGITFSNLKGTQWVPDDFLNPAFRSEGAQQVPQVGFFFDTATATDGK